MLLVDTNVLVYAAAADSPFHAACRSWLERQRGRPDAWYTSWTILYEFLRVTTHLRVMRQPWSAATAWNFVQALLASPGLSVLVPTQRHPAVAEQVIGGIPHLAGRQLDLTLALGPIPLLPCHGSLRECLHLFFGGMDWG